MLKMKRAMMLLFALTLCAGSALHTARAAFDTQALASTRGLLDIPEAWVRGASRTIVLNGARVRVATGRSQESLHALLDRAESECRERSAGLHARANRIADRVHQALPPLADGILRSENEREGLVACLELGTDETSFEDLAVRLTEFAEEGDLQALGGVRMVRAEARGDKAFFVSTWNEGRTPLWQMFPETGDAPGIEFADVPRPSGARRVLSTWQEQGAPALNVYESTESAQPLMQRYLSALSQLGWQGGDAESVRNGGNHQLMLTRNGHQLVLTAESQDGKTRLAVMPLTAGPGAASVSAGLGVAR